MANNKKIMSAIALNMLVLTVTVPMNVSAEIVIGQTSGFSGASAASVKEGTDGAKLYIDSVNKRGGINGHQVLLVSLDDKADAKLAAANARALIVERGAIALFFTRGTPQAEAILPLLNEFGVPLIAPSTGAAVLHTPVNKYVFNVRSTYQREAEQAILLLKAIGVSAIAVVHVDDSFGRDALAGARRGFDSAKLTPALIEKFDKAKPDFSTIAANVTKLHAQAVVVFGSGATVADAVVAIRAAGSTAQIVTLSNNAASGFVAALKQNAAGTIVTQIFPNENITSSTLATEAQTLARASGQGLITPGTLEGFAAAKVLVEGLRRAGSKPTGEKIRNALENIKNFDLGGMDITYSPTDHTGLDFVELSIIGKDGKFKR